MNNMSDMEVLALMVQVMLVLGVLALIAERTLPPVVDFFGRLFMRQIDAVVLYFKARRRAAMLRKTSAELVRDYNLRSLSDTGLVLWMNGMFIPQHRREDIWKHARQ